jgi:hypothetical protein
MVGAAAAHAGSATAGASVHAGGANRAGLRAQRRGYRNLKFNLMVSADCEPT